MKLSTWAATLSILTSSIVIVGTWAIVCFTEPHVPRTHPTIPPENTPRKIGASSLASEPRGTEPAEAPPSYPGVARSQGVRLASERETRVVHLSAPGVVAETAPGPFPSPATVERAISAAGLCGVPAGIGLRLFARESGFRQFDARGRLLVSSSGAAGIGQIKPSSAAEVSPTLDVRDEWQNMVASMCYLSSRRGTWREKVLAYRVGASGVRTAAVHAYASTVIGDGK